MTVQAQARETIDDVELSEVVVIFTVCTILTLYVALTATTRFLSLGAAMTTGIALTGAIISGVGVLVQNRD